MHEQEAEAEGPSYQPLVGKEGWQAFTEPDCSPAVTGVRIVASNPAEDHVTDVIIVVSASRTAGVEGMARLYDPPPRLRSAPPTVLRGERSRYRTCSLA